MIDTLEGIRLSRVQNNLPVLSLALEENLVKLFLGSKLSIKLLFHARVLSLQGVEDMSLKDIEYYGIWYLAKVGAKTVSHERYLRRNKTLSSPEQFASALSCIGRASGYLVLRKSIEYKNAIPCESIFSPRNRRYVLEKHTALRYMVLSKGGCKNCFS